MCRGKLTPDVIGPPPPALRELLSSLKVLCEHSGCEAVVPYDSIKTHQVVCAHNPERPVSCNNCDLQMKASELVNHDCVAALKAIVLKQQRLLHTLLEENVAKDNEIGLLKRWCQTLGMSWFRP